jgi:glycosyltransferase involved in cell wall biosynthesis
MRVLHLSTWGEVCGIADYARQLVASLEAIDVASDVAPLGVRDLKLVSDAEFTDRLRAFAARAPGYDVVHIQHEFSFFAGRAGMLRSILRFRDLLGELEAVGVPVVVTFHTDPAFGTFGRRSWRTHVRTPIERLAWRWRVAPFFGTRGRYRALVHSERSAVALRSSGFAAEHIHRVPFGYPDRDGALGGRDVAQAKERLGFPRGCVLLSIFGFVSRHKGHEWVTRALKMLPDRYCLAIIGGPHPGSVDDRTVERVLRLWDGEDPARLRITGWVPRETVDAYHAATDVCLVPYLPVTLSASAGLAWALTSGKPTIASRIQTFVDLNHEADCLLLVTPRAPHELVWQIERLVGDVDLQRRLAQNARRYAAEHSSLRAAETTRAIYADVIGAPAEVDVPSVSDTLRLVRRSS